MGAATGLQSTQPAQTAASPLAPAKPSLSNRTAELKGYEDTLTDKLTGIKKQTDALEPPKLDDMPPPPKPVNTDPVQVWGSTAMALAALGSLMSRQPLTTALNASAAVMQAYKKGDVDQANAEYARWKVATDNAIKVHKFEMDSYKAAISKAGVDEKGAVAEFTAHAKAFADETAAQVAQQQGYLGIQKLMVDREKLNLQFQKSLPQVIENQNFMSIYKSADFQKQLKDEPDPIKRANMTSKLLQETAPTLAKTNGVLTDDDLKSMSEQYLAGDTSVISGLGYGNTGAANRSRLQHMIRETAREQGMSGAEIAAAIAEFGGIKSGERALGTRTAQIGMAGAELEKVLPLARKASDALPREKFVPYNQAVQMAQKAGSDPAIRKFVAANTTLINVYARAISPTGVPTVSDKDHAREMLSEAFDQPSYNAVLDQMEAEVAAAKASPGIVRKEFRGAVTKGGFDQPGGLQVNPPQKGHVEDGWRFLGGDPAKPENWEKNWEKP